MVAALRALEKVRQHNLVFVVDSTFISSDEFVERYTRAVRRSETSNFFNVQTRLQGLHRSTLDRLHKARVINYFFGVESSSDAVLTNVRKGLTWADIVTGLGVAREFFVQTLDYEVPPYRANFIQGLPGEDAAQRLVEISRRRYLIHEELILLVNDSIFQPTPGSTVYRHPDRYGLTLPSRYRTMLRGALPAYSFREPTMSSLSIFLHHLQMRQTANDALIERLRIDRVREEAEQMLYRGELPDRVERYVRC